MLIHNCYMWGLYVIEPKLSLSLSVYFDRNSRSAWECFRLPYVHRSRACHAFRAPSCMNWWKWWHSYLPPKHYRLVLSFNFCDLAKCTQLDGFDYRCPSAWQGGNELGWWDGEHRNSATNRNRRKTRTGWIKPVKNLVSALNSMSWWELENFPFCYYLANEQAQGNMKRNYQLETNGKPHKKKYDGKNLWVYCGIIGAKGRTGEAGNVRQNREPESKRNRQQTELQYEARSATSSLRGHSVFPDRKKEAEQKRLEKLKEIIVSYNSRSMSVPEREKGKNGYTAEREVQTWGKQTLKVGPIDLTEAKERDRCEN